MNPDQEFAIKTTGNLVLQAPPGTGKTETLSRKIQYLIEEQHETPEKILCLTHTRNAADNMRERLKQIMGSRSASKVVISTIHSLAYDLIIKHISHCTIASPLERKRIIRDIQGSQDLFDLMDRSIEENPIEAFKQKAYERIQFEAELPTNYKKNGTGLLKKAQDRIDRLQLYLDQIQAYEEYERRMKERKLLTYDHSLKEALKIIKETPQLKSYFKHILVDEYQDIGESQIEIIRGIKGPNTPITVAGDQNQSIFGFNGTVSNSFQRFQTDFEIEDFCTSSFNHNFRSTPDIQAVSNYIISHQLPSMEIQKKPFLLRFVSKEAEALGVAQRIKSLVDEGVKGSHIAVLFKKHATGDLISKALRYYDVPFLPSRKPDITQSPVVTALRLVLKYIIAESSADTVLKGQGEGILFRLLQGKHLIRHEVSSLEIDKYWKSHRHHIREYAGHHDDEVSCLIKRVEKILSFYYEAVKPSVLLARMFLEFRCRENLHIFRTLMEYAKDKESKGNYTIESLLSEVEDSISMKIPIEETPPLGHDVLNEDKVVLLSCHGSKSLGFPHVYIADCNDKNWKVQNEFIKEVFGNREDTEDETRKLFHVATSRAMKHLTISFSGTPCTYVQELMDADLTTPIYSVVEEEDIIAFQAQVESFTSFELQTYIKEGIILPPISPTLLEEIETCPTCAYYKAIEKIYLPRPCGDDTPSTIGSKIHSILEDIHKKKISTGVFPSIEGYEVPITKVEAFKRYITSREPLWKKEHDECVRIDVEKTINCLLGDIPLTGRLDRNNLFPDKKCVIVDYKTGKKPKDKKLETQATFYVLLLLQLKMVEKVEDVCVVFDFMDQDNPDEPIHVSEEDIDKMVVRIKKAYEDIFSMRRCDKKSCCWCGWS
jgi:superfamily I DNA/RNA helicase